MSLAQFKEGMLVPGCQGSWRGEEVLDAMLA